jgi:O-antigen/teichoic acid export membrane protein
MVGARLLATLLAAPAALAASFFIDTHAGELAWMSLALAGSSAIASARNPALLAQERSGHFGPGASTEAMGQLAAVGIVAALVLWWPSIWLLVLGQGIASMVSTAASYLVARPQFGARPTWSDLRELTRQGRPFLVISATTYVTSNLDKLLLGAMLSPGAAGVFFVAQRIADAPRQLFASVIGRTTLPYYSSQMERHGCDGLRIAIHRFLAATAVAFVGAALVALAAYFMIPEGPHRTKWLPIVALLPVIMIGTGFRTSCHAISPGLTIAGRMDVDARMKIQESVAYFVALPLAIAAWGAMGAAVAFAGIYAISMYRRYNAVLSFAVPSGPTVPEPERPQP